MSADRGSVGVAGPGVPAVAAGSAGPAGAAGVVTGSADVGRPADADPVSVDVAGYAAALAEGIEAALPGWVERVVAEIMIAWVGAVPLEVAAQAHDAGRSAAVEVGPRVRALLERDIDQQRTTPLAILRGMAVRYPTEVLVAAGVPPVVRDQAAEELFPEDLYDLVPAAFADLDPSLADIGLRWGAAKAFEHKQRHGGTR